MYGGKAIGFTKMCVSFLIYILSANKYASRNVYHALKNANLLSTSIFGQIF